MVNKGKEYTRRKLRRVWKLTSELLLKFWSLAKVFNCKTLVKVFFDLGN